MPVCQQTHYHEHDIFAALTQLGVAGYDPVLSEQFRGGQCHVFRVDFVNVQSVAVRVPVQNTSEEDGSETEIEIRQSVIESLRHETEILNELEKKGFPWSPRRLAQSLTFDNAIRAPFLVLTWIHGLQLSWDGEQPERRTRDKVLGQLAKIQMNLIDVTLKDGTSASESLLAMDHGDLKPGNIIVDADDNIQGIIDWGFAGYTPLPRAAGLPRFLWPLVDAPFLPSSIQQDRQAHTSSLSQDASPAAAYMRQWQTGLDVDFVTLYLESLFSKGMHLRLAQMEWKLPVLDDSLDGGDTPIRD